MMLEFSVRMCCTVLSLLSKMSHLVGRHSAVQLTAWAWYDADSSQSEVDD